MTIPGIGPITATASRRWRHRQRPLPRAATLQPGSGSRRGNTRPAASSGSARFEDGRAHAAAAPDHRQQRGRATCEQARGSAGLVARADAGPKAAHAGHGRTGQQDRPDRLGGVVKQEDYRAPVAARRKLGGPEVVGEAGDRRRVWHNSRRDGTGRTSVPPCLEHAWMMWIRSANSHTGQQLQPAQRGRTDGSIRLRADLLQKTACISRGVHR